MTRALREYRVKFERVPKGQKAVRNPNKLGLRSKLGGKPNWIQGTEVPVCDCCGDKMVFVMQLDSIEHDEDHNPHRIDAMSNKQHYMFSDVGMLYLFCCLDCCESKSVFQMG